MVIRTKNNLNNRNNSVHNVQPMVISVLKLRRQHFRKFINKLIISNTFVISKLSPQRDRFPDYFKRDNIKKNIKIIMKNNNNNKKKSIKMNAIKIFN